MGQYQVLPVHVRPDPAGVALQPGGRLTPGGEPDVLGRDRGAVEGGEGLGGVRGPLDAVAAEPVRGDGRGQVEAVGVGSQRGPPDGHTTGPAARGVQDERVGRGPVGVVGARVRHEYGHVGRGGQRPHERARLLGQAGHHDRPAAEAGLAQQLGYVVLGGGAAQRVDTRGVQDGGEGRQAVALARFPQVGGERAVLQPGGQAPDEDVGVAARGGQRSRHREQQAEERGVRGVVAEEMADEPVRDAQRTGQEGTLGFLDLQQAQCAQRGRGVEADRAATTCAGTPHRSRARPTVARRRLTSLLR